jgi:uncharacterized protein YbjT (DUF2867 family)
MLRVLVTGATGYIGGRLVPRLLEKGYAVRCLARNPKVLKDRGWTGAELIEGDVLAPETLEAALEGIDIAYYLVHSMAGGESEFAQRDRRAAANFATAARQAGIQRMIYLGGLGAKEKMLSPHLRSRQEVGEILRQSGVSVTEFRAAIVIGSGSVSFEMIRYLTERLPVMLCPKWVKSLCQPIAIRDVLAYLIQAIEAARSTGKILEIGGADVLSYRDMMLGYAKQRGLKRYLIPVPVLTPRLSSYWVDLVTPIPASLARPLIEGLKNDVVCQDFQAREIFSIQPLGYREAIRLALQRIGEGQVETIWSGSQVSMGKGENAVHSLEIREGMMIETRRTRVQASPSAVFKVFSRIGGERRWFFANWAWQLRGLIDRLVGGVGMRRGRRNPEQLLVGDALDFWRVEDIQADRLLRLRAEMKLPGKAWLQFELSPIEGETKQALLTQTAFFEPKGLGGIFYWYFLYPMHRWIFSGLSKKIQRRSERI